MLVCRLVEPLFLITVQAAKNVRCETRTLRRRQAHRFSRTLAAPFAMSSELERPIGCEKNFALHGSQQNHRGNNRNPLNAQRKSSPAGTVLRVQS